jgi:hypothetical protein
VFFKDFRKKKKEKRRKKQETRKKTNDKSVASSFLILRYERIFFLLKLLSIGVLVFPW